MTRRLLVAASVLGCVAAAAADAAAAPTPCAELAKLSLPETTITAAEEIPAGSTRRRWVSGRRTCRRSAGSRSRYRRRSGSKCGCRRIDGTAAIEEKAAVDTPAKSRTAIRKIWNGPTSTSGQRLWFGLERGTPLGGLAGANGFPIAAAHFQYWIHQDPKFDWRTLDEAAFEADFKTSQKKFHATIGTDEAKLDAFRKRGGKVIIGTARRIR